MENGRWKMENGKMEDGKRGVWPFFPSSLFPFPFSPFPPSILHDRRGSVAVQAFLLLPIFVLVVFGGYEILRAMSVKQALHDGTYQAARYLALNPITNTRSGQWEEVAQALIEQELAAEVGEQKARLVQVRVIPPRHIPPWCGDAFRVEAFFRWEFEVPFAQRFSIPLRERYEARVICG